MREERASLLRRARKRKVGRWLPRGLESTSDIALGQICMKCFREQEDHSFGRRVSCTARALPILKPPSFKAWPRSIIPTIRSQIPGYVVRT